MWIDAFSAKPDPKIIGDKFSRFTEFEDKYRNIRDITLTIEELKGNKEFIHFPGEILIAVFSKLRLCGFWRRRRQFAELPRIL
jgi:hypothetical protein